MTLTVRLSPNVSPRPSGVKPIYLCYHQTEGSYDGSVAWLCNPQAQASADEVISKDGEHVAILCRMNSRMKTWSAGNANPYIARAFENETYIPKGSTQRVPFNGYATLAARIKVAQHEAEIVFGSKIPLRLSRFKGDPGIVSHGQLAKWYGGSDHFSCGTAISQAKLMTALGVADRKWVVRTRGKVYGRYVTLRQAFRATRNLFGRGRRNVTISKER